jgi:hypothetical protein
MQNEIMTSAQNVVLSGRSVDEITADIRADYRNAEAAIEMLNHGEWLPYLQGLNISVSSAENYMRYAAEVPGNDQLAALPYSAAIALIALPEDEREQFMQDNDIEDKSAAEIKRLIAATKQEAEKRKKAEEALSQAQLDLHQAQTVLSVAERGRDAYKEQLDKAQEKMEYLEAQLDREQNKPQETEIVEKVVAPAGYEQMQRDLDSLRQRCEEAEEAAAEAEKRAAAAVADAQRAQIQQLDAADQDEEAGDGLNVFDFVTVCNEFSGKVWAVPFMDFRAINEDALRSYRLMTNGVKCWAERVLSAIDAAKAPIPAEGVIILDADAE